MYLHFPFWTSREMSLKQYGKYTFWAPAPPAPTRCALRDLSKDIFLKVQNETWINSELRCLLGDFAYGVHLFSNILIFQGKPESRPVYHTTSSESMRRCFGAWKSCGDGQWCSSSSAGRSPFLVNKEYIYIHCIYTVYIYIYIYIAIYIMRRE